MIGPQYRHTHHYMAEALRHMVSPRAIRRDLHAVEGVNAKLAVLLTHVVGTMWCFYAFNLIAVPAVVEAVSGGTLLPIINAVSSNWLQLILLPGIMVGQAVMQVAADDRARRQFEHTEAIKADMEQTLDLLDEHTAGGLGTVIELLQRLEAKR